MACSESQTILASHLLIHRLIFDQAFVKLMSASFHESIGGVSQMSTDHSTQATSNFMRENFASIVKRHLIEAVQAPDVVMTFAGAGVLLGLAAEVVSPDDAQVLTAYLMGQFTPAFLAMCAGWRCYGVVETWILSLLTASAAVATVCAVESMTTESSAPVGSI